MLKLTLPPNAAGSLCGRHRRPARHPHRRGLGTPVTRIAGGEHLDEAALLRGDLFEPEVAGGGAHASTGDPDYTSISRNEPLSSSAKFCSQALTRMRSAIRSLSESSASRNVRS